MKRIYYDHSGTTLIDERVIETMAKSMWDLWGNASSVHSFGREAKAKLEECREIIAKSLHQVELKPIISLCWEQQNIFRIKNGT